MRKTSVYLDEQAARRLAEFAARERRPQAEVIRAAIEAYVPAAGDHQFALDGQFARIDDDPRPIADIPDEELLKGFGA